MTDLRRCIGSGKFGIEAHEASPEDFPAQPSQKDGLGRMCKPHWNQYTSALRKASLARTAAEPTRGIEDEPVANEPTSPTSLAGEVATMPVTEKPTRPAPAQHVELLDPPVGRPRRKTPADAAPVAKA